MLSKEQVSLFYEQGYLGNVSFIPSDLLGDLQAELAENLASARFLKQSDDRFDLAPDHSVDRVRCRRVREPYRFMESFKQLLHSKEVLDVAQSLLGKDVYFRDMPLNMKPPSIQRNEIGWHQDWAFEPLSYDGALTITVALVDCTKDNGALRLVPYTHRSDHILDHHINGQFTGYVDPNSKQVDWDKEILLESPAGAISVHHCRLLHGSGLNTSEQDRPLQAIGLCAGDAWPYRKDGSLWEKAELEPYVLSGAIQKPKIDTTIPKHMDMERLVKTDSLFDLQQSTQFKMKTD